MNMQQARFNMIEQQIRPWNVLDLDVLEILEQIPRENFVAAGQEVLAYVDTELPLPCGQFMLSPRVQARLFHDAKIQAHETVLEIGTGSGYLTALLASKAKEVVSLELHQEIADLAKANLSQAGISNVEVVHADAVQYKSPKGPFDVIVLTGSVASVPTFIFDQLKVLGRVIAIVGHEPMMRTTIYKSISENQYETTQPWDTVAPRLVGFPEPNEFQF